MKKIIFIFTIALMICSCKDKTNPAWTDVYRDNLKGPVAKVEIIGYHITDILPNGEFVAEHTSDVYTNGPMSNGSGYVVDEYDVYGRKYFHSMEGNGDVKITWEKYFLEFEFGSKWPIARYYYDRNGSLANKVKRIKNQNDEYIEEMEYDSFGNKVAIYCVDLNDADLCTYFCRASLSRKPYYKYTYGYDDEGRLESCWYIDCSMNMDWTYEITYKNGIRKSFNRLVGGEIVKSFAANKHGDWTEYDDGEIVYEKYDKFGNWEVRIIYEDDCPLYKEVRVITYFE